MVEILKNIGYGSAVILLVALGVIVFMLPTIIALKYDIPALLLIYIPFLFLPVAYAIGETARKEKQ